jgi:voltage-gated potassium channel
MNRLSARRALYDFLELDIPCTRGKMLFRAFMYILISVNIFLVIFESAPELPYGITSLSHAVYVFSIGIFVFLYLLRLWICVENPRFSRPVAGRLLFMATPYAVVDLAVIIAFTVPVSFLQNPTTYEFVKFLRLTVIFKLVRYSDALQTMIRIFAAKRKPLGMALYMVVFLLVITSTMMYYFEHPAQPNVFTSVPESMWWGVETLTTVGYGDIVPVTAMGKVLGGITALLGIAMFAIPAGILASGFYEEYRLRLKKEEKEGRSQTGHGNEQMPVCPTCGRPLEEHSGQAPDEPKT